VVAPSGQIAAVGSANGVKLVGLPGGNVLATLTGHNEGETIEGLIFVDLLDGRGGGKGVVLVSGGTDGKGFVWDVATGNVRAELSHDVSVLLPISFLSSASMSLAKLLEWFSSALCSRRH
jgi:ribosome assembly protein SQT1